MAEENSDHQKKIRSAKGLATVNVMIWAIAVVAMVFLMQDAPAVKNLFPILAGGIAVGVALITAITQAGRPS